MNSTLDKFNEMLSSMGSDVLYHRESESGTPCPCRTPEGFRDPNWHWDNPVAPECNEQGILAATVNEFTVKAAVQPAIPRGRTRPAQRVNELLGDIERDDQIGIFPCAWDRNTLSFYEWSNAGNEYVVYDGRRYVVVAADKIPDLDGNPNHHWEVGLRLVKLRRPTDG